MHAPVDLDVFHRARPGAAVLHRAVLVARLRRLYAGQRQPTEPARDLERRRVPRVPRRAARRPAARRLRQLRPALELVTRCPGSIFRRSVQRFAAENATKSKSWTGFPMVESESARRVALVIP